MWDLKFLFFTVAMKIQGTHLLFFKNISIKPLFLKNWRKWTARIFFWSAIKWTNKWNNCVFCKKKIQNWNIFQIIVNLKSLVFCRCNEDSGKGTFVFQKHINQFTLLQKLKKIKRTHIFWISTKVILQVKQPRFLQKKKK